MKINHIYIFIAFIFAIGCQSEQKTDFSFSSKSKFDSTTSALNSTLKFIQDSVNVNQNNVPLDKDQFYFPLKLFPVKEYYYAGDSSGVQKFKTRIIEGEKDTFVVKWYSKYLYRMKEPLLFNLKGKIETYRFTWLRSFDNPIAIRIEKENDTYTLYWKVCDGAGGYDPGKLIINKSKIISKADWSRFKNKLKESNFWSLEPGRASLGTDGSEWIMEGAKSNNYHVVTIWSPSDGKYYEACRYLLELTNLDIPKDKIY